MEFSSVSIGGGAAWRSKEMEKIKAANKSDVTTILRLNLPFSLFRLPDGLYELKDNEDIYKLAISKHYRNPEVAKQITGWTPQGDIEIIGDRFGRFSYSQVEISIPYKIIDLEVFDYFCPNCSLEVEENTTTCSSCGANFSPEKSRRPPRKKVKTKAIEIINKFLDAYRFFFKDYFVEHIRYDDVINYGIEYRLRDGTRAFWQEEFDMSLGSSVKTGSLTANEETAGKFRAFLSAPEQRMMLRDYLLSSSANRISTEEYHLAILEAVIALEITLSDYIVDKMTKLELPKDENKEFLIYVGAYGNVKVILRLLTKDKPQLPDTIYEECGKAITKRNKIMHEAKTSATYGEAKKILWNVSKMIEYISNLKE